MEIIYLTDIHDDLKRLRQVLLNTSADLYIISGDLIYKAFFTEKLLYEFVYIQEEFYSYLVHNNIKGTPSELAFSIDRMPEDYPPDFRQKAEKYLKLFQMASRNMKVKYQFMKDLVEKYTSADLIVLPGNYDLDLQYTALYEYDLHKKCRSINNIKFCGYGGAPIATSGIPELVSVIFYEYIVEGRIHSEPQNFFESTAPDIALLHNPAYGTLDKLASFGRIGSHGIRQYIDKYHPALVLSGHVHSDYGIMRIEQTICINPSNFGKVDTLEGFEGGGYFCKLHVEKTDRLVLHSVELNRVLDKTIHKIAEFTLDSNLAIKEKVYDEDEYSRMGGFIK